MNTYTKLLLLLLCLNTSSFYAQTFPKLISELYPYHEDPTTVYWREDQHCVPSKIGRFVVLTNGDTNLHYYQRTISSSFSSSTQQRTISVTAKGYLLSDRGYNHVYDTLGRKIYFEERRPNPNPPPNNLVVYQSKRYYYRGNSPWLDSLTILGPNSDRKRDVFLYDQNDRLVTTEHYYRTQSNAPWIKSGFETRIYDASGLLIRIEIYTTEPTVALVQFSDINYDANNRISTIISTDATTNVLSEKYAYFYNDIDSTSKQVQYHWFNNAWLSDREKTINLGYMNRIDEIINLPEGGGTVNTKWTLHYAPGETCPLTCDDDWLNLNQHYRLYFSYPTTGTNDPAEAELPLAVYPNPANGIFWLESPAESKLEVLDMLGRVVWTGLSSGKDQVVLPGVTAGQYLLRVSLNDRVAVRKIISF
ncbi:MAG TPA: T9SS type A sorting domain-containing protein [Saprospiraceae bacterium]|nr:T9SS type A sorting domain-containing protein [Saprospiraceae bacterium]